MKKRTLSHASILLTLIFLMVTAMAQADIYMKQKRHSDGFKIMGQQKPAEDVIEEIWITDDGFRSDNPRNSMIMLLDKKKIIMIDHGNKNYTEMPMDMGDMMSKIKKGKDDEDAEAFQNMMNSMMKLEANVQITSEKEKIKGWNCKKYILTLTTFMGPITKEIWATEELKIDMDLYAKFSSAMMAVMPGLQNAMSEMMKEMKKIEGVQVRTISTQKIMNQTTTSTTELLEFKDQKAPAGLFKIPQGYKQKKLE